MHHYKPGMLFLANSDIYPNLTGLPHLMLSRDGAYAFARKEVLTLASTHRSTQIYRGGLDVFAIGADALEALWRVLSKDPVSERMAFGVPGWDYYMAAGIRHQNVNGQILDGPFFLHQSHCTSYSNVAEFNWYIPALKASGFVSTDNYVAAAEEFASYVNAQCTKNEDTSRKLQLCYDSFVFRDRGKVESIPSAPIEIFKMVAEDPLLAVYLPRINELYLHITTNEISQLVLFSHMADSNSNVKKFSDYLRLLYLVVRIRRATKSFNVRKFYPVGNAHRAAIEQVLKTSDAMSRRFYHLDIVCNELIVHGILNNNDFEAIALSCINDAERQLVNAILCNFNHE